MNIIRLAHLFGVAYSTVCTLVHDTSLEITIKNIYQFLNRESLNM